jgi:hypothetical protein
MRQPAPETALCIIHPAGVHVLRVLTLVQNKHTQVYQPLPTLPPASINCLHSVGLPPTALTELSELGITERHQAGIPRAAYSNKTGALSVLHSNGFQRQPRGRSGTESIMTDGQCREAETQAVHHPDSTTRFCNRHGPFQNFNRHAGISWMPASWQSND